MRSLKSQRFEDSKGFKFKYLLRKVSSAISLAAPAAGVRAGSFILSNVTRRPLRSSSGIHTFIPGVSCLLVFAGALGVTFLLMAPFSLFGQPLGGEWEARQVYLENCSGCHGFDRTGFVGVALDPAALVALSEAAVRALIKNGVFDTLMPRWDCRLPLEQLRLLSHYLKDIPAETEKEIRAASDGRLVALPAPSAWWQDRQVIESGRSLFREYCMGCHHPEYEAFAPAYAVVAVKRDIREVVGQIKFPFSSSRILGYGKQTMPKFDLTDPQIKALGAYVISYRGTPANEKDAED